MTPFTGDSFKGWFLLIFIFLNTNSPAGMSPFLSAVTVPISSPSSNFELGELLPVVSSSTKGFVDKKWSGVASPCSLYGGGQETLIGRYTGQDAYCTLLVCVSFYNLSNTSLFLISFTENSCQAKKIAGIDYTFRFSNKNLYVQASDTMITAYILTDSAGFVFAS